MPESRKEREFRLREQEILDAAAALFEEKGLDNVTVADIAKTTDIGKGTIYKHFVSKDTIMARLSCDFAYEVLDRMAMVDSSQSCQHQMRQLFELSFVSHIESPLKSELCRRCDQEVFYDRLPPEYQQAFDDIEMKYFQMLSGIFAQGVAEGVLPEKPIDELLLGAFATYLGALDMLNNKTFRCFKDSPALTRDKFITNIINFTMTGIFGYSDTPANLSGDSHE
ncbi:TetR/AcrR family transcriptional regulator [Psychrobium sp. MM17-31]|uniref:TetR/AcrR family transcriptional regulator n=1 Tax=Psychrobium sp. MM17-31 TaxID=2917758 RepID=UPI001EF446D9|nr:TetR/AcrR family transcriptional regulator [Psychrobium sp. MM17-31]MCG7531079.1 TetR/AcrR family transcriptional regulator [Psychrobium sp. MM17-31]